MTRKRNLKQALEHVVLTGFVPWQSESDKERTQIMQDMNLIWYKPRFTWIPAEGREAKARVEEPDGGRYYLTDAGIITLFDESKQME